jgi:hypothetical protein
VAGAKADLIVICKPIVYKMCEPRRHGPSRPVTGIDLSFYDKKVRIKRYEKIRINNGKARKKKTVRNRTDM